MHRIFLTLAVVLAAATFGQRTAAQTLTSSFFERYLETMREQAGIPGMSALVLQSGVVTWEQGFGRADIETGERAAPYTPYLIGDLSQTIGATLFLNKCIEEGFATVNDQVAAWLPGFSDGSTLGQLAAHVAPTGAFRYDRGRFATLTPVIEKCADTPYQKLVDDLFVRLTMNDAAPGTALAAPTADDRAMFGSPRLDYHAAVIQRMATPYRVEGGRSVRTTLPPTRADAANGIVASALDLAKFDDALTNQIRLLEPPTVQGAWTQVAPNFPTGLGWFVQNYNGNAIVWHFGVVDGAYSSLIVKVPNRRLTFILLANSDNLSAPFALENGDVTASVFARLFLRIYLPNP